MTKETTNAKTEKVIIGRPKITFTDKDWKALNSLIELQATREEIASVFDIDSDTLSRIIKDRFNCTFSSYFKQKSGFKKIALRRAQFKAATEQNNTALMIWLGKNWLGQKDAQEVTASINLNGFEVIADQDEDLSE